jgi:glycogen debranching enzyme
MRKLWTLFLLALSINGGWGVIPKAEQLFEDLAIKVPAKEKAQFIYGDNIAGFYEGYTHDYTKGQGYVMVNGAIFRDFASYKGGVFNNKKEADYSKICPQGIQTYYKGCFDEMILHSMEYAVSLSVYADSADILGILPIASMAAKKTDVADKKGVYLFSPQGDTSKSVIPTFVAVSANVPFTMTLADRDNTNQYPELKKPLNLNKMMLIPIFSSKEKVKKFTINIAFGFTADEAVKKAEYLAKKSGDDLQKKKVYDLLTASYLWTDDMEYNRALMWAKLGAYVMVEREFGEGIWAGLPWFKQNWGRDTFISLPGTLIVTGQFQDAMGVLTNFSVFQNKGELGMEITFPDDNKELKAQIKDYLKANFGEKMTFKAGKILCTPKRYYLDHVDELKKKIEKMKKDIPGVTDVTYKIDIGVNYGRIPNRVASLEDIIYNTTDGTPWFIREALEYIRYTGDLKFAKEIYPVVKLGIEGAIKNYVDANGFLTHDDADTWMDARIAGNLPWSARGNRAVDIQVLWYVALQSGVTLAEFNGDKASVKVWMEIIDKLKVNFPKYFWDDSQKILADRVNKSDVPDFKVRPNQLMVISVPFEDRFVSPEIEAYILKNAVSELLYPYGIASLSQNDPYFHPYHENWDKYHKDAAYHNGTVWGWNAGFTVTALTHYGYTELAYALATNLGNQILYMGCRGNMSELVEAIPKNGKIKLSGTYAQAWSVAEYVRNGYQDFAGFKPNLIANEINLMPSVPEKWNVFSSEMSFGSGAKFSIDFKRDKGILFYTVSYKGYSKPLTLNFTPLAGKERILVTVAMKAGKTVKIEFDPAKKTVKVDGKAAKVTTYLKSYESIIGDLKFVVPNTSADYPTLKEKDYLQKIIESKKFK